MIQQSVLTRLYPIEYITLSVITYLLHPDDELLFESYVDLNK